MTITHPKTVVLETANKLVVVLFRVELFMRSPEFMTTMRRPGRLFKIRKSTAHDNRIATGQYSSLRVSAVVLILGGSDDMEVDEQDRDK